MQLKNTKHNFGVVSIILHWLMAILIVCMIAVGLYMTDLPKSPEKFQFYGWHKEFGILILMLAIVRLTWRLRNITPTLEASPRWEMITARTVHWAFYFFMFANPLTGWMMSSSAGVSVSFFGLFTLPNLVSPSKTGQALFATIHQYLAFTLIAILCLHTAAALKHHFINKDSILRRMLRP